MMIDTDGGKLQASSIYKEKKKFGTFKTLQLGGTYFLYAPLTFLFDFQTKH
jgi:hypothetical protein